MNQRSIPGKSLLKFSELLRPAPDWISTIELFSFYEAVKNSENPIRVLWDENSCFFLEEGASRSAYIHGFFRDWQVLKTLRENVKETAHMALGLKPDIQGSQIVLNGGFILCRKPTGERENVSRGDVGREEVLRLITTRNPELMNSWFVNDIDQSLAGRTYHVRKNSSGEIEFLHLLTPQSDHFRGIYFTSSLTFPDTIKEFYKGHSIAGDKEVRAVVMERNDSSMNLHKMIGYEETGRINYYLELPAT
jgi:hypothetical protein